MSRAHERYAMLLESAIRSGYDDELEKIAGAEMAFIRPALFLGEKVAPAVLKAAPALGKAVSKAVPAIGGAAEKAAPAVVEAARPVTNFGKRLSYGLTGRAPGLGKAPTRGALKGIGIEAAESKGVHTIKKEVAKELESPLRSPIQWAKKKITGKGPSASVVEALTKRKQEEAAAAEKLFELTRGHLPGSIKAMATHPLQTMGASYKSMGPGTKAMLTGMTAAEVAGLRDLDEMSPEEKGKYLARTAAGVPLWLGTGGISGMIPSIAAWELGGRPAEALGGVVGKAVGGPQPALTPEQLTQMRTELGAQ